MTEEDMKDTKYDVYECEGKHKIILERKAEWGEEVMETVACPFCKNLAFYNGSLKTLAELEAKRNPCVSCSQAKCKLPKETVKAFLNAGITKVEITVLECENYTKKKEESA